MSGYNTHFQQDTSPAYPPLNVIIPLSDTQSEEPISVSSSIELLDESTAPASPCPMIE